MRHLADFPSERAASALADHLEVGGVEASVREGNSVWVLDDDQLEQAHALMEGFDGKVDQAAAVKIRKKREADAKPKATVRVKPANVEAPMGSATVLMIVISVIVGLASEFGGDVNTELLRALFIVEPKGADGVMVSVLSWDQPWRVLTPMFIHFGIMHLGFNMLWLYRLGNQVEDNHGTALFLLLVVATDLPGNLLQFYISGPLFGGMSGVVYGLFGFVWMHSRYSPRSTYAIDNTTVWLLMGWLVLCATGMMGPVANAGHAGGLAGGLLCGLPAYWRHRRQHASSAADFAKGSWADINVVGWQRIEAQFIKPFLPIWFMLIAVGMLVLDAYGMLG